MPYNESSMQKQLHDRQFGYYMVKVFGWLMLALACEHLPNDTEIGEGERERERVEGA